MKKYRGIFFRRSFDWVLENNVPFWNAYAVTSPRWHEWESSFSGGGCGFDGEIFPELECGWEGRVNGVALGERSHGFDWREYKIFINELVMQLLILLCAEMSAINLS